MSRNGLKALLQELLESRFARLHHAERGLRWRALGAGVWLAVGVSWLAAPAAAGAASLHPKLVAPVSYGAAPIGFARTSDGVLHLAFETNKDWGNSASGVGAIAISPSGHIGSPVQALTWTGLPGGNPSGIPGLAVLPSGALQATFGGSPSGVPGPWAISSTDGGNTWSAPVNVGSGLLNSGDSGVDIAVSNGTPVLVTGCCGSVVVQQGLGVGMPTSQVTDASDNAAGNTTVAVDAATGAVIAGWDSNAGSGGLWLQQIAPTVGAAQKVPIPSQYGTGTPLGVAGRDSGPGVFAAYPADHGTTTTHMRLLRYGGGSVAVGAVKGMTVVNWGVATSLAGRIWVAWYGQRNGKWYTAFTRSNKAVTRFEPIQLFSSTWSTLLSISGDGRLGPLDALMSGMPSGAKAMNGIYYARVLPVLTVSASGHQLGRTKLGRTSFRVKVRVTDAGDAVAGATVSARGVRAKTGSTGKASLTLKGSSGAKVTLKVSSPGYRAAEKGVAL